MNAVRSEPRCWAALLREGAARLEAAGVPGAAGDARRLLAHAAGVDPGRLILLLPEDCSPEGAREFDRLIARRTLREPVSHLIGRREFFGRSFEVGPTVLDPRPETETLVVQALGADFETVLDLGTGTGCILLTLLCERRHARGTGIDLSGDALAVAERNAATLKLTSRTDLGISDWFDDVEGRFDLIVSNPPYIATSQMAALAPELRRFEPRVALEGGEDGLDAYRIIVTGAATHLSPGGRLMVEIGPTQGHAVAALFEQQGARDIHVYADLDGRDRVVTGRWSGC
ncbi:peptide chain release factor N(5)-glutamine methyltransferase [Roseovarius sp. TE539]|uniref:peptide chain release factor N(5)-glutamine methyltransferase n=1 Tax=Roseovarius sp. TE539 TaxID=2249812 RepID=UPI000DE05C98|nr:peptide chain release factor N(5)-glutamine methyltransferase [Roseovarius sp. TE539]RBI75161.1 peptide chain release factor N(5)-glutamine methyltransferase [Roseovarius sp. TE539]